MGNKRYTQLAKKLRPFLLSAGQAAAQQMITAGEGPGIDIANNLIGLGGDSILLYKSNGDPVAEFAITETGLKAAIAAAAALASGGVVQLPICDITLTSPIVISSGLVRIIGMGEARVYSVIRKAQFEISGGGVYLDNINLNNVQVNDTELTTLLIWGAGTVMARNSYLYIDNGGNGVTSAIKCLGTGDSSLQGCDVTVINSGAGDVHAAAMHGAGKLNVRGTLVDGSSVSVGATGYAGYRDPACAGSLYFLGGRALGSDPDNPFNE